MELELSFAKDVFSKDEFNVDKFLQESCQKSGLHKLHKELGTYIKYLQSMIVDLVNNESNAIVNLSSDLKVLQNKFGDLSTPLGQLKEELMQIYKMIDTNLTSVKYLLGKKESIASLKCSKLNELRMLSTSQKVGSILQSHANEDEIEMEIIERSVNQYIMQIMYAQLCNGEDYNLKNTEILNGVLNAVFLKSVRECDSDKCLRCLQMYMLMNAQVVAEDVYRVAIVRPYMNDVLNETVLRNCGGELGLVYDKVIVFVEKDAKFLLGVVNRNTEITGFNFVLGSIWIEVSEQLRLNLSPIFAPGNPGTFRRRYLATRELVRRLEAPLGGPALAQFRNHPSLRGHLRRWNLQVYLEIRQREAVQRVEAALEGGPGGASGGGWRLQGLRLAWEEGLLGCFSEEVFLPQLLDKFWKLVLQIISRINIWVSTQLKTDPTKPDRLQTLIDLHHDVSHLINLLSGDLSWTNGAVPPALEAPAKASLEEFTLRALPNRLAELLNAIVELVLEESSAYLSQVAAVPRLYRKTNRAPPQGPSGYVSAMLAPLEGLGKVQELPDSAAVKAFGSLTEKFAAELRATLEGVRRTGQSLRRLRGRRREADGQGDDDRRIRDQLGLDVVSFCEVAEKWTDVEELRKLLAEEDLGGE